MSISLCQVWRQRSSSFWALAWLFGASMWACKEKDDTVLAPPVAVPTDAGTPSEAAAPIATRWVPDTSPTGADASTGQAVDAHSDASVPANPAATCIGTPDVGFFSDALAICGADCKVCIQHLLEGRVAGYFAPESGQCACSPPQPYPGPDAGQSGPPQTGCSARGGYLTRSQAEQTCAAEPAACRVCLANGTSPDAGLAWSVVPAQCSCPEPDGVSCGSQTGLSEAQASAACAGLSDCHLCVQETDQSGTATLWLAHACGCPAPYVTPQH